MNDHVNVFIWTLWTLHIFLCARFFLICEELLPGIFHRVYVGLQAGSAEAEMRVKHLLKDIRLKNCWRRWVQVWYVFVILVVLIYTLVVLVEFLIYIYIRIWKLTSWSWWWWWWCPRRQDNHWELEVGPPEIWDIQYREIVRLAVPCTRMSCLWPSVFGRNWRGHYNSPLRTVMRISPDFAQ